MKHAKCVGKTRAHANQNTQVQFVQTMMHTAAKRALNVHFYVIDLLCTHRLLLRVFSEMSSRVVASFVCSQVLYRSCQINSEGSKAL